jgi:hypothetical protein
VSYYIFIDHLGRTNDLELVIRTTQLLLKVEDSIQQQESDSGNSMVIGTFPL